MSHTFLLAAINAKYIHSNPGIRSLKLYAESVRSVGTHSDWSVSLTEYTINHQMDQILQDIYRKKPDVIGFSCYIWNMSYIQGMLRDLKKVLPDIPIWLGGPEVSYDAPILLSEEPSVKGIMIGEGEGTFSELLAHYEQGLFDDHLSSIKGICFRNENGKIITTPLRSPISMDEIPFLYKNAGELENKIIYYESSRGCPYSCSYCLSSIEKSVRFRSLDLVLPELQFFLDQKFPQVKFVDRTFNCKKSHSIGIWRYLTEHDNGITNFHFEISADILSREELDILKTMRPGLIQLEIGVQTTNPDTIQEIHRNMDLKKLVSIVNEIHSYRNIHQHLDLIVGLPFESFERFKKSYDDVYAMKPDQLQLGFLKVLKGSYMASQTSRYQLQYHEQAPYEVLSTEWISYDEVLRLKILEDMNEVYYNSGQFTNTLKRMESFWSSPYRMFEELGDYYQENQYLGISHNRLARYEILYDFLKTKIANSDDLLSFRDSLMIDLYLRENLKSRPKFAPDIPSEKSKIRDFYITEKQRCNYLKGYEAYDSRQLANMTHIEVLNDGRYLLFDYRNRDPLNHNACYFDITSEFCS